MRDSEIEGHLKKLEQGDFVSAQLLGNAGEKELAGPKGPAIVKGIADALENGENNDVRSSAAGSLFRIMGIVRDLKGNRPDLGKEYDHAVEVLKSLAATDNFAIKHNCIAALDRLGINTAVKTRLRI